MHPRIRRKNRRGAGRVGLAFVRSVSQLVAFALVATVAPGCAAESLGSHTAASSVAGESLAVLRIERTAQIDRPDAASTSVDAAFTRFQGISAEEVLELLGWPTSHVGADYCRWDATAGIAMPLGDAIVDLLDVGPIQLDLGVDALILEGRLFPAVHDVLSGTIYAEELAASLEDPLEYRVYVAGGASVGSVERVFAPPTPLSGISLNGEELTAGMTLRRDRHVTLGWEENDPQDRVELEIRAGGRHLRCSTSDEGIFRLRSEGLAALPADDAAQITVARVRRESLNVGGFEESWVRLVSRWTAPVVLR